MKLWGAEILMMPLPRKGPSWEEAEPSCAQRDIATCRNGTVCCAWFSCHYSLSVLAHPTKAIRITIKKVIALHSSVDVL